MTSPWRHDPLHQRRLNKALTRSRRNTENRNRTTAQQRRTQRRKDNREQTT